MFSRSTIVILALCITIAIACHGGSHPKSHGSKTHKCKHSKEGGSGSGSNEEDCVPVKEGSEETYTDSDYTNDETVNVKVTVSPSRK